MNNELECLLKEAFPDTVCEIVSEFQEDGLTNQNYIITVDNNRYAVRLGRRNAYELGINREGEYAALKAVAEAGIGAEVVYFSVETGNMVTKYIDGVKWKAEDTKELENMERIVSVMKKVHELPEIPYHFSPYKDINYRIEYARKNNLYLPADIEILVAGMKEIQRERKKYEALYTGLCHNDPFPNNYLDDGTLRLIDWEYSGMGDIFFDLAIICMPFRKEQKEEFLMKYFGDCNEENLSALKQMEYIVTLWNAMWAVMQLRLSQGEGSVNYKDISDYLFSEARNIMNIIL